MSNQAETKITANEAAWCVGKDRILSLQTCDTGYDYSLLDGQYNLIDGGQLDDPCISMIEARTEILKSFGIENRELRAMAYEDVMERISGMERARQLLQCFFVHEYKDSADDNFPDLENVELAYTDYEESDYGPYMVQVNADLIRFQIRTYVNKILVSTVTFDSLSELCDNFLEGMDHDALVYITDEEWETYRNTVAANNGKNADDIKMQYPTGTRIRLIRMAPDPLPVEPGSIGTVTHVDDMGQLQMQWDCHRSLALIPGVDLFEMLDNAT